MAAQQTQAASDALAAFGPDAAAAIRADKRAAHPFLLSIAAQDSTNEKAGADSKASPASIRGLARPKAELLSKMPVFPSTSADIKSQAALVIGGVNGTWHTMEQWLPEIAARVDGPVYAYEGL